jgi:hypothetical protein
MGRMRRWLLVVAAMLLGVFGCQEPRIDGSSMRRLGESFEQVREALPESRRGALDEAMRIYILVRIQAADWSNNFNLALSQDVPEIREELDGLTAAQFIQKSAVLVKELESKQAAAFAAKSAEKISEVEVTDVAVEDGKATFTIKNNLYYNLVRTDFTLTLSYPNSGQPFARDTVAGNIPMKGLAPGMTQDWIIPIDFIDQVPEGAVLDVQLVAVHCANDLCKYEVEAESPLYAE